jgi:hypothetical protein
MSPCHCSACHATFSGIRLFDTHRRGGRCLDPTTIRGPLRLVGGIWREPAMSDEVRAKVAG